MKLKNSQMKGKLFYTINCHRSAAKSVISGTGVLLTLAKSKWGSY